MWLAACLMAGTAAADPVDRIACPEGIYHIKPFHMTIDYGARTVTLKEAPGLAPQDADALAIEGNVVHWGFMRGDIAYHRDSHILEWDATAEYDYLSTIGHAPSEPRELLCRQSAMQSGEVIAPVLCHGQRMRRQLTYYRSHPLPRMAQTGFAYGVDVFLVFGSIGGVCRFAPTCRRCAEASSAAHHVNHVII